MLVYNCRPSDSVFVKTPNNNIQLLVDKIINQQPSKQVQLKVKTNDLETNYLLKPNDSFSLQVDESYLDIKIGHTSPSRTTLYVGTLKDAMFKFHKGNTPIYDI